MNLINGVLALVFVSAFAGCGKDGDDDTGTMNTGGTGGSGSSSEVNVAACQASVDAVRAACSTEDPTEPRLCIYDAYRSFCETGRTAVVKAIFDCLKLDACQTPSDPSDAADCVADVVYTQATADDHAAGAAICACPGDAADPACEASEPSILLPDIMLLSDADERTLTTCLAAGCNEDECLNASPLGTANQCPGL